MLVSAEDLAQMLANVVDSVWQAEWHRADLCHALTEVYDKPEIKAIANSIGRSHQDIYRWAKLARQWPQGERAADKSPREHTRMANARKKV